MANSTTVTSSALARAATLADDNASAIKTALNNLMNELAPLFGAAFKGDAATAFTSVSNEVNADLNQITQALHSLSAKVASGNQQYTATDETSGTDMKALTPQSGTILSQLRSSL
jgi:WXG100 family type VII secretion target